MFRMYCMEVFLGIGTGCCFATAIVAAVWYFQGAFLGG